MSVAVYAALKRVLRSSDTIKTLSQRKAVSNIQRCCLQLIKSFIIVPSIISRRKTKKPHIRYLLIGWCRFCVHLSGSKDIC